MFEAPILVSPFTTRDLSQEQLAECRSLNGPVRSGKSDIDIHPVCFRLILMRWWRMPRYQESDVSYPFKKGSQPVSNVR
jgi:hypothetical protein